MLEVVPIKRYKRSDSNILDNFKPEPIKKKLWFTQSMIGSSNSIRQDRTLRTSQTSILKSSKLKKRPRSNFSVQNSHQDGLQRTQTLESMDWREVTISVRELERNITNQKCLESKIFIWPLI